MQRGLLALSSVALYALHQDFWYWLDARPLAFGFLPIGLWYHAVYTLAVSALMWLLVRAAWPSHLEECLPVEQGLTLTEPSDVGRSPGSAAGPPARHSSPVQTGPSQRPASGPAADPGLRPTDKDARP
jgi:hypothetical protein